MSMRGWYFRRAVLIVIMCAIALCLRRARGQQISDVAANIQTIAASGRLPDLRWPDFPDYRDQVKELYALDHYGPAWVHEGKASSQAEAMIAVFQSADNKGLNAEDYEGSRWSARFSELNDPAGIAKFDVALTVCALRYISDLDLGRVTPEQLKLGLTVRTSKHDFAQFLRDRIAHGNDINSALAEIEPPFPGYKRMLAVLQHYRDLSSRYQVEPLPASGKSIDPGSHYSGVQQLAQRLSVVGDLPTGTPPPADDTYEGPIVDAVKRFQERHGLAMDGRIGPQTLTQLNVPLTQRVEQLRLTLERWRWVPHEFPQPPVVVNIPEFRLRTYDSEGHIVLMMNVIVGKAFRHQTPVFDRDMKFVVFRPYWNVPPSIQRSEIVPAIERDRNYIAKKNYEVVTHGGQVVTSGAISDDVLQQLRGGKLAVRQKPGANNALGLVKLMFPNEYNVYLHSTPSPQLFSQTRRDFSHGCIRVEKPDELAAWALQGNPNWTIERVRAAMQTGKDNVQVNLTKPIPVLIIYGTAVVDESGTAHFFDDIYGHDAALAKLLAKGYPYNR
jgi:murein L,D-transpeptidase YcbB/YkuD